MHWPPTYKWVFVSIWCHESGCGAVEQRGLCHQSQLLRQYVDCYHKQHKTTQTTQNNTKQHKQTTQINNTNKQHKQ